MRTGAADGRQLDGRAERYALAATAFHLLTGKPPFSHSNPAVVISQHLSAAPPAIADHRPDLPGVDSVLAKALAKDPSDRFERCADFARALTHRLTAAAPDDPGATETVTDTVTTAPAAPSAAVIGANCAPLDSTATTESGATAYCSSVPGSGPTIWSLTQGEVPSPTSDSRPRIRPRSRCPPKRRSRC